ncbi:MAG: ribonuclease R [Pseudomonadota bacterium]
MGRLPSKDEILAWVRENPGASGKREIARAFGIKGADRVSLKDMLRELKAEGVLSGDRKAYRAPGSLPPVAVLVVQPPDRSGDLWAHPQDWEDGPPPRVALIPGPKDPALGEGDRVLVRISATETGYQGRLIRRIGTGPRKVLGVFRRADRGGRIQPVDKKARHEWIVAAGDTAQAREGELVEGEALGRPGLGLPKARVTARLGDPGAPRAVSLIAIHALGIPMAFSDAAEAEAEAAQPVPLAGRTDLRALPLVTIDPEDARDHDDAVAAQPDPDPVNPGGWLVWVAIADVAAYVRPGSALDADARERGNSTYFPDRVVPMLPEALSADLCSLHAQVDRPCLAVRLTLGADGTLRGHEFVRGMMRSHASLTYEQVQAARDGRPDTETAPLMDRVISPLFAAYAAAKAARDRRAPLDLDLPERRVALSARGEVSAITFRERFDAHRLIEEFMILANVAAAEALEAKRRPLLFRVHEAPPEDKLEALGEAAEGCGLAFAPGQTVRTSVFNRLLDQAAGQDFAELIHLSVLRAQTQAYYGPDNLGHFGLNLRAYAHFTSPIRRYADLLVHRALIAAHGWGPDPVADGQTEAEAAMLQPIAAHISMTERRAMEAERDTTDRYLAAFLADRVGSVFAGRIAGLGRAGVFVKLDETGADGFVPISALGAEYFHHDAASQTLIGAQTGQVIALGLRVQVRLAEAVPVTGGLLFALLEIDGRSLAGGDPARSGRRGRAGARPKVVRRKPGQPGRPGRPGRRGGS